MTDKQLPKAKIISNPYIGDIDIWQNIRLATRQGFDTGSNKQLAADDAHYQAEHQRVVREIHWWLISQQGAEINRSIILDFETKYLSGEPKSVCPLCEGNKLYEEQTYRQVICPTCKGTGKADE